jgi:DNA-binding GntR family transcriptional regulator
VTRPAPGRDRIVADVERGIRAGELLPGQALDSEAVLAERYSVARGTVRAALAQLADRGLIESVPGSGWFVRGAGEPPRGQADRVSAVVGELREELRSGGRKAGDPFFSEKDLCERFGLTRYAARAALMRLEVEGLIVAVHGRGRFVAGVK